MNKLLYCVEVYKSIMKLKDNSFFMSQCGLCWKGAKNAYNVYFKYYDKENSQIFSYYVSMCALCFNQKIYHIPINDISPIIPLLLMKEHHKPIPHMTYLNPFHEHFFSEDYVKKYFTEYKRQDKYEKDDLIYEIYAGRPKEAYHEK